MIVKTFELRDSMTFIPIIAIKPSTDTENDRYLVSRAGYGMSSYDQSQYVIMGRLDCGKQFCYDPYAWGDRTFHVAHKYIAENFDRLYSGQVIDVQWILKEKPLVSESENEYHQVISMELPDDA